MKRILLLVAMLAATSARAAWMMGNATATDLGTLGGLNAEALDINASGQIVGWSDTIGGPRNAFRYQNGTISSLIPALASWNTGATGINDAGVVVGWHYDPTHSDDPSFAFRWTNGLTFSLLAGMAQNGVAYSTSAVDVTNSGRIAGRRAVGWSTDAILWQANYQFVHVESFATPTANFEFMNVSDLNNAGDVVGWAGDADNGFVFRWSGNLLSRITVPNPVPPPGLKSSWSGVHGINDKGHVVGSGTIYGDGTSDGRAVYWDGVALHANFIGVLSGGKKSHAEDINEGDFVIGWSQVTDQLPPPAFNPTYVRAMLYHKDFGMKALPIPSGWPQYTECRALALNERKSTGLLEVVGYCTANGLKRAVLWTVNILSVRS